MVGVDLDLVARLERSMLTSWPALSVAFDGDWVIRLANGVTKRSNSVTCLSDDDADLDRRIDHVEAVYRRHSLPAVFRLSPLASPALDASLEGRGWKHFDETIVMTCDLAELAASAAGDVAIAGRPDRAWLESCYRLDGLNANYLATLGSMLGRLVPPAGYGRIGGGERIDALALVVVDVELVGVFEVQTSERRRRQGLASMLLRRLFHWSLAQGATTAWLAVVAENLPALRLYQGLGFREIYRYHYRSKG